MIFLGYLTWISGPNRFRMEVVCKSGYIPKKLLTRKLKITHVARNIIFQKPMVVFHASFLGCILNFWALQTCGKSSLDMDTQISPYWKWNTWSKQSLVQHPCGNFLGCIPHICLDGLKRCLFIQHELFGVRRWNGINHLQAAKPNFDVIWWCKIEGFLNLYPFFLFGRKVSLKSWLKVRSELQGYGEALDRQAKLWAGNAKNGTATQT